MSRRNPGHRISRPMYRERRDAMVAALSEFMPMCSWNVPDGGFYVWVRLPEGLDAKDICWDKRRRRVRTGNRS